MGVNATLYTIVPHEVIADDYIILRRMNYFNKIIPFGKDKGILPVEDIKIPVHHIIRNVQTANESIVREDKFIAFDPDLEQMLKAPFIAKMEAAQKRQEAATNLLNLAINSQARFLSLPWYKRIWKAFRKEIF